ncbi:hypothetical protein [Candidatus Venteria ishoeyi]|uniref:Uncharacterized protein n=1 Tax=Candidatus Venteria ishoeyi TaxID=1899563 RepID=A0A1H6FDB9_9GAMM|nr:hypothetical protein [Candidatus Venteria ishoeyi]MDM8546477.1 hypothetical protein [Candidatus Venteria ishoeyi]SEH08072.1 Uncharacterised protein [Candidatus Venteria ishoeyi]
MLYEILQVKQVKGEPLRRWFMDQEFDLMLWLDETHVRIIGFQLVYNKTREARVITWQHDKGCSHDRMDDGENRPGRYKSSPILLPDGVFRAKYLIESFRQAAGNLTANDVNFVCKKLKLCEQNLSR